MNRRHFWLGGTAAAAAAAGGLGWRALEERRAKAVDAVTPVAAATAASRGNKDSAELWQMRFPRPGGGELRMSTLRGAPLVLNFWATWCPPCVLEMPELDRFAREFAARGVRVAGLAVDNEKAVAEFLARAPVSYAIGLAGFGGTDLSRRLGNGGGSLPFTAVFGRGGDVVWRKLGVTDRDELARQVQEL